MNGINFASLSEARRYSKLAMLQEYGFISDLELQPSFQFTHEGIKICKYLADFRFKYEGKVYVEDVKGMVTDVFAIKQKMMCAFYPDVNLCLIGV